MVIRTLLTTLAVALAVGGGFAAAAEPATPAAAPPVNAEIKIGDAGTGETKAAAAIAPSSIAKVILKTTTTGDGVPIVYPTGTAQVTVRDVVFPPGSKTAMHRHPIPLFAYMLEGELTITTEGEPPRHYKAGDAFMETAGWHVGHNAGSEPARLISVYMGNTEEPLSLTHK